VNLSEDCRLPQSEFFQRFGRDFIHGSSETRDENPFYTRSGFDAVHGSFIAGVTIPFISVHFDDFAFLHGKPVSVTDKSVFVQFEVTGKPFRPKFLNRFRHRGVVVSRLCHGFLIFVTNAGFWASLLVKKHDDRHVVAS